MILYIPINVENFNFNTSCDGLNEISPIVGHLNTQFPVGDAVWGSLQGLGVRASASLEEVFEVLKVFHNPQFSVFVSCYGSRCELSTVSAAMPDACCLTHTAPL